MSITSCTEFELLLDDLVESGGSVNAVPLSKHSATCAACHEKWQRHLLLEIAVADWRTRVPRSDLVETVLARFAFEQSASSTRELTRQTAARSAAIAADGARHCQAWGSVAVAALALLVATFMLFRTSAPVVDLAGRNAQQTVAQRTLDRAAAEESDEDLEALVANAGSAYLVLANDAAGAVANASRIIAPTNRLAVLGTDPTETGAQPAGAWENEFQPIGREFREALDFLFDAVPVESPSSI